MTYVNRLNPPRINRVLSYAITSPPLIEVVSRAKFYTDSECERILLKVTSTSVAWDKKLKNSSNDEQAFPKNFSYCALLRAFAGQLSTHTRKIKGIKLVQYHSGCLGKNILTNLVIHNSADYQKFIARFGTTSSPFFFLLAVCRNDGDTVPSEFQGTAQVHKCYRVLIFGDKSDDVLKDFYMEITDVNSFVTFSQFKTDLVYKLKGTPYSELSPSEMNIVIDYYDPTDNTQWGVSDEDDMEYFNMKSMTNPDLILAVRVSSKTVKSSIVAAHPSMKSSKASYRDVIDGFLAQ
jgi:hypothetical protein